MPSTPKARNARTLSSLTQRLKRQHRRLEQLIARESRHKLPDFLRLQHLKKLRLSVKEKLGRAEGVIRTIGKPIRPDAA